MTHDKMSGLIIEAEAVFKDAVSRGTVSPGDGLELAQVAALVDIAYSLDDIASTLRAIRKEME